MAVGLLSCPFFSSPSLDVSPFLPFLLSINLSLHNLPEYRADSEAPREREGKQANPAVRSPAKGHKSSQAPSAPVKQLEWKHTHTHISSDKAMAKTDQTNKTIHSHYTQILTAKANVRNLLEWVVVQVFILTKNWLNGLLRPTLIAVFTAKPQKKSCNSDFTYCNCEFKGYSQKKIILPSFT